MHPDLRWFFIFLALLWVGWYITGGPERTQTNRENPFIQESTPYRSGDIYGVDELKERNK